MRAFVLAFVLALSLHAQGVKYMPQIPGMDAVGYLGWSYVGTGIYSSIPAACLTGNVYVCLGAGCTRTMYYCSATDTWTGIATGLTASTELSDTAALVRGAAGLTTTNAIPKGSGTPGNLTDSAIRDNGTAVTMAGRTLGSDPGGAVPAWAKYSFVKIANGVNGCTNAKGCGQVNAGTPVAAATATSQVFTWLAAPANAALEAVRIKTSTACAGITVITISAIGTTASAAEFYTGGTYNLKTAVSNTQLLWPILLTPGLTAAGTNWTVTVAAGAENMDDITNGCAFDLHARWSVLP